MAESYTKKFDFSYIGEYLRSDYNKDNLGNRRYNNVIIKAQDGYIFDSITIDQNGHLLAWDTNPLQRFEYICVPICYGLSGDVDEKIVNGNYSGDNSFNKYDNSINHPDFRNALLQTIINSLNTGNQNHVKKLELNGQTFEDFNNINKILQKVQIGVNYYDTQTNEYKSISTQSSQSNPLYGLIIIYNKKLGEQDVYIGTTTNGVETINKAQKVYSSIGNNKQIRVYDKIGYNSTYTDYQTSWQSYIDNDIFRYYDFNVGNEYNIISISDYFNYGSLNIYLKKKDLNPEIVLKYASNNTPINDNGVTLDESALIIKADINNDNGGSLSWDYTQGTDNTESFGFSTTGLPNNQIRIIPNKTEPNYNQNKLNQGIVEVSIEQSIENSYVGLTASYIEDFSSDVFDREENGLYINYNRMNANDFNSAYVTTNNGHIVYSYSTNLTAQYPDAVDKTINVTYSKNIGIEYNNEIFYPFIKETGYENNYIWEVATDEGKSLPNGVTLDNNTGKTVTVTNTNNSSVTIPAGTIRTYICKDMNDSLNTSFNWDYGYNAQFTIPGVQSQPTGYYWYLGTTKPTDDAFIESNGTISQNSITSININDNDNYQYFAWPKEWGEPTLIDTANNGEFTIGNISSLKTAFDENSNSIYNCRRVSKNTGDITCNITWIK